MDLRQASPPPLPPAAAKEEAELLPPAVKGELPSPEWALGSTKTSFMVGIEI